WRWFLVGSRLRQGPLTRIAHAIRPLPRGRGDDEARPCPCFTSPSGERSAEGRVRRPFPPPLPRHPALAQRAAQIGAAAVEVGGGDQLELAAGIEEAVAGG